MAKRFGGPNSPGGPHQAGKPPSAGAKPGAAPPPLRRVNPAGARVNLLFVLPFLFAFRAFFRDPAGLAGNLGVFALLMFAAWLGTK